MNGQYNDLGSGRDGFDAGNAFQPAYSGQLEINEQNLGHASPLQLGQCFFAGTGGHCATHARPRGKQLDDRVPKELVVFDNPDFNVLIAHQTPRVAGWPKLPESGCRATWRVYAIL